MSKTFHPPSRTRAKEQRALSLWRLSKNAKIPFDELRVSGKILSKMDIKPLRLSLSKPRFGENRHPLWRERVG
jgi:hypothetical protein